MRQTYLASKLKFVKGQDFEIYNTEEVKKEHKEDANADEETEAEDETPVPHVTHVNIILNPIWSIVEVYINSQQIYNSNGPYSHKS